MKLTAFIIATVALLTAGLATGVKVYYMLAILILVLMLISAASALWVLFTFKIEMKGVRSRVERGDALMTIFTASHKSILPVAAIKVYLSVPSSSAAAQQISMNMAPFTTRTFRYMIRCPHRGSYEVGVSRICAKDLFDLFTFYRKADSKLMRVDVYPKSRQVQALELKAGDSGPEVVSRSAEDASSPSDIRKWQDGDALKKVHWKLSMRKRELMVRTYEESARPDTLIIPDLAEVSALEDHRLTIEDCVCEECLSQARAQLEGGFPIRMPLTCARPSELSGKFPQDFSMFSDALMRVRFDSPYSYEQVLATMLGRTQRTGGAVLVTPKLTTRVADMALRLQRSGIRTRVIWVTDTRRTQSLEMIERLKMENVEAAMADPWRDAV